MARHPLRTDPRRRPPRARWRTTAGLLALLALIAGSLYGWLRSGQPLGPLSVPVPVTPSPSPPPRPSGSATNPAVDALPRPPAEPAATNLALQKASPAPTNQPAPILIPEAELDQLPDRFPTNILEAQIALTSYGISPGSIDGVGGAQTAWALRAFQFQRGLEETGRLDRDTQSDLRPVRPWFRTYTITAEDLAGLHTVPSTWLGKSQMPRLGYQTILELVGEQSQATGGLLKRLNPGIHWDAVAPGTRVIVPNAQYPSPRRAALVRISLANRYLRAFDSGGNLLAHFPCSIGRIAAKRPVGELHVVVAAEDPNYTFDPVVFPESAEARQLGRRLILPPGPNNPVGVAWIGLNRPGYGIHGTPEPEQVGRTESHGCFRLANWNADYLLRMVVIGTPVWVEL